jgi:hypothetical protein
MGFLHPAAYVVVRLLVKGPIPDQASARQQPKFSTPER